MKRLRGLLFVVGVGLAPAPALGQEAEDPNPLESVLYAPELIMQHRRAIDLNDEQRDAISRMIQELQGRVMSLQWQLLDEIETLKETLGEDRIDQDRALDQMERLLDTEKEIKQANLELLIRIKNVLTPAQQRTLDGLRAPAGGDQP